MAGELLAGRKNPHMVTGDQNLPGFRGLGATCPRSHSLSQALKDLFVHLIVNFFLIHRFSDYHVAGTHWISVDVKLI